MQDVESGIFAIIARKAGVESGAISRQTELAGLNINSVDTLEVAFEIEEEFDISLVLNANRSAGEPALKTAGDAVDMVTVQLGKGDPAPPR